MPLIVSSSTPEVARAGRGGTPSPDGALRLAAGLAVLVALLLRSIQYFDSGSLWYDEAMVSASIIHRPVSGLFAPLDYHQGAPLGFLLLQKLVVSLLGTGEMALRLVPFAAAVVGVGLFQAVARRALSARAVPLALMFLALSFPLVYYAAEAKQYSGDVFVALAVSLVVLRALPRPGWRAAAELTLAGALGIWLSHPAAFMLTSAALVLGAVWVPRGGWRALQFLAVPSLAWAASVLAVYLLSLRRLTGDTVQLANFAHAFMPLPPTSLEDLRWFRVLATLFRWPAGFAPSGLAVFALGLFAVGCAAMHRDRRATLALLLLPPFGALLASGLHLYPFDGRLLLFAVPALLLPTAEGAVVVMTGGRRAVRVAGTLAVALLLGGQFHEVLAKVPRGTEGHPRSEIGPIVEQVHRARAADDVVIFFPTSVPVDYYRERVGWSDHTRTVGATSRSAAEGCIRALLRSPAPPRVWLILSRVNGSWPRPEDAAGVRALLDRAGARIRSFEADGASAGLYELRARAAGPDAAPGPAGSGPCSRL